MAALDNIASELLKSANEADLNYKKTRDQAQRDKAVRLRRIVENLRQLVFGASDLNGLSDVTISAPANAQVLTYNSTTSQWENQTPAAGGVTQIVAGTNITISPIGGTGVVTINANLTGYVPYTGATATVNLNTQQLLAGHTTITTNGSTDALTINHTSGSGKGINVTKGGNGEGLYINKTSGSGNAATIIGTLEATTIVKTGGTSSQFLKADGSVDSTAYLSAIPTLAQVTTAGNTTTNAITVGGLIVDTNTLVVDSVNNRVGFGTTAPAYRADVQGLVATDAVRSHIGYDIYPVPDPTSLSGVVSAGGSVDTGLHGYYVSFYTALGETHGYGAISITTTAGNNTVTLTIPTSSDPRVIGRKLYRTKAGSVFNEYLLATITNNTATSYVDTVADSTLTTNYRGVYYRANTTSNFLTIGGTKFMIADINATYFGIRVGASVTSGGYNTFFGSYTGENTTTGASNTFVGHYTGRLNTTGESNTVIGTTAYYAVTTGSSNVVIGFNAGRYIADNSTQVTSVNNGIYIGFRANVSATTGITNEMVFGHQVTGLGSNTVVLGNDSIVRTALKGNVMIGTTTDAGYKLDVNGTLRVQNIPAGTADYDRFLVSDSGAVKYRIGSEILSDIDVPGYVSSRGENLVTNGTGLRKSNYNFSAFTFVGSEAYYSTGSFRDTNYSSAPTTDEAIPVDVNQRYRLSATARQNPYVGARYYIGVSLIDADGFPVQASNHMYKANTLTTLAAPLNTGDTVVYLTSAANWENGGTAGVNTHLRSFIFWNYVNSLGYAFPALTYSRNYHGNMWDPGSVNTTTNTITLRVPWPNSTVPAGTQLSNGSSGGTYKYITAGNVQIPNAWTTYTGTISGVDLTGTNQSDKFAPGTAAIKILFLNNRDVPGATVYYTNVQFALDLLNPVNQILNQNAVVQTANFSISGTGYVGTRLGVGASSSSRVLTVGGDILLNTNNVGLLGKSTGGSDLEMFKIDSSNNIQFGTPFNGAASIFYAGTLTDWYQYPSSVLTHRMRLSANGNLLIGTTTDAGYKLDVNGTTRVQGTTTITPAANTSAIVSTGYSVTGSGTTPLVDLSGTWNTTGAPTLIRANVTATATGGLSTVKLIDLQIGGASCFNVNGFGGVTAPLSFSASTTTSFRNITFGGTASENTFSASSNIQPTAGTRNIYFSSIAFTPTSGTATLTNFIVAGSINQTGGANGITRGLYVNPTITAAADWRSIEWSNNTGWGLYGTGTGLNYLNGGLLIGTTTNAGYKLDVNGTARVQSDLTVASLTTDGPVKSLSGMLVSVAGYTGSFTVPTNPPGMQTLDIQDGIIVNIL